MEEFSLYKMFIGDTSLLILAEITFRTSFMYLYTLANVRLMDRHSLSQLSPFEMIIIFALGAAVGDPMFYTHVPLVQCMVVISSIVCVERLLAFIAERNRFFEKIIEGDPILIIKNGAIIPAALKKQRLPQDELNSILRTKGIRSIGEIEYAFIEPSGEISVIVFQQPKNGTSTLNSL